MTRRCCNIRVGFYLVSLIIQMRISSGQSCDLDGSFQVLACCIPSPHLHPALLPSTAKGPQQVPPQEASEHTKKGPTAPASPATAGRSAPQEHHIQVHSPLHPLLFGVLQYIVLSHVWSYMPPSMEFSSIHTNPVQAYIFLEMIHFVTQHPSL